MSPLIPTEIYELFFLYISRGDHPIRNLKSCALTCRIFSAISRRYIFNTIEISYARPDQFGQLSKAFLMNSSLGEYVRNLIIRDSVLPGYTHLLEDYSLEISRILRLLSQLNRMELIYHGSRSLTVSWAKLRVEIRAAFGDILKADYFSSLHLSHVSDVPVSLIMNCTGLKTLDLTHVRMEDSSNDTSTTTPYSPTCTRLDLFTFRNSNQAASILIRLAARSQSAFEFSLCSTVKWCPETLAEAIETSQDILPLFGSHPLHKFAVHLGLAEHAVLAGLSRHLFMQSCTLLQSFTMDVQIWPFKDRNATLGPTLSSLLNTFTSPNNLREINILISGGRTFLTSDAVDQIIKHGKLQELDVLLTGPKFPELRKVNFQLIVSTFKVVRQRQQILQMIENGLTGLVTSTSIELKLEAR
ncbi:hypothetical protein BDQ12DRAFT_724991 [Crucibulum laeve]|uniref:F-box domain-containing protein n=1 Tax=Crucibulum laeve TaxID=68775 RepID=A0A5C3LU94_9AGAR|nr:hypothetical protein BDQ12DRAFT_724991 [Crucibulum laeve]